MLRTRLWMGSLLVGLAVGVLVLDERLDPWYPFLFLFVLILTWLACSELLRLLGPALRPPAWFCYTAVTALVLANWPAHRLPREWGPSPWSWVLGAFIAVVLAAFLVEMATFREPGGSVIRIALTLWIAAYLGLLPSCFVQLRWPASTAAQAEAHTHGTLALALTIFVPKSCDIGAYFTGRFLGRHRLTPVLSPKKTWEGLAGGLAAAVVTALALNRLGPVLPGANLTDLYAVGFGITVGLAGVFGDLAESLIKRDGQHKDASQAVPGFGGVLDIVDSVLIAAPVAYCWLRLA